MKTNSLAKVVVTFSLATYLLVASSLAQPRSGNSSASRGETVHIYSSGNRAVISNVDPRIRASNYTREGRPVIETRQSPPRGVEFNPGYRASQSATRNEFPTAQTPDPDQQVDPLTGNVVPVTLLSIPF